ncbi:MAG: tryptophan 7-halogenase, partial [Bacteroidota bacterium]|nr:tryptophan 7-halogenase [Bacteroidota bacterium]
MKHVAQPRYDILIAGAGFAGSLTALILNQLGLRVCLVEKGSHPRFAIGESSTPVADMILRSLSSQYHLPWLADFSRYGSWQETHPEIICGIKRGFSYFKQEPGKPFHTTAAHQNELLVAASTSDLLSDTNWLRADFDLFLTEKVKEFGIDYLDHTEIVSGQKESSWKFEAQCDGKTEWLEASFLIDATGSGSFVERLLGIPSESAQFRTHSFAIYSHFEGVPHWMDLLHRMGFSTSDYPYDPDYSALHQVLEEGWLWMLRFNDERVSMGLVLDQHLNDYSGSSAEEIWKTFTQKYPALQEIIKEATFHEIPGQLIRSARLQRRMRQGYGKGWVALPHSIGFVDPLFSSGIAHTLSGIEKIIPIVKEAWGNESLMQNLLLQYQQGVFDELDLVDQIVAGSYRAFPDFNLFNAWSMCYFAATIAHEQRRL